MAAKAQETTVQLHLLQKGGQFEITQVAKATPAPGRLLVKAQATALNGLDLKQRDVGLFIKNFPHVLGIEGAGTVQAVASDISDFQVGDEIMACMAGQAHGEEWGGSYQEHVQVPARFFVAKKPNNISVVEAASLPIGYVTAVCAVRNGLDLPLPFLPDTPKSGNAASSVLILGGSSAVGAAAIQLLRIGYPDLLIFATASSRHHSNLISLGATKVFDYHSSSLVSDIKASTPDSKGIDMIIDCVSAGATQQDICQVFHPAGSKLYAAIVTSIPVPVSEGVTRVDVDGWSLLDIKGGESVLPALTELVERGMYKVPLGVKIVGEGLAQIPSVMDEVTKVSGEKLVVVL